MLRILLGATLLLLPIVGQAQEDPTGAELNQDWIAFNIAHGHLQKALSAYTTKSSRDAALLKDADDRLKWVLDNWVPKALPTEDKK